MSRSPQKKLVVNMQLVSAHVAQRQLVKLLNGDHSCRLCSSHRDVRRLSFLCVCVCVEQLLDSRQSQAFQHNAPRCSLLARLGKRLGVTTLSKP